MTPSTKSHGHGLTMGALGMLIISPDGLLLRLIENTDTWTIIFYRSLFLGISLALALLVTYRQQFVRIWLDLGKSGWLSAAILTGTIIGFITAITHTTVANTLIILATMPLFAALLARLILGERISRRTAVSISVACIGILIIFSDSLGGGHWKGDLMAALTAFLHGLNLVLVRKYGQKNAVPALCLSGFGAALISSLFATPEQTSHQDLAILSLLGLLIIPLSLSLFISGARFAPAADIALFALLETVLGPLWVWLGVGEIPSNLALAGGALVILAIGANALLPTTEIQSASSSNN